MLRNIGISALNYKPYIRQPMKEPRPRFVQYYRDLYAKIGGKLDEHVLVQGDQASYSALGESVLEVAYQQGELEALDLLVAAYWSVEFDPDHASCGAYLSHQYKLKCKLFDVCEQGTLSPFTAIKLIKSFMQQQEIKKSLLLILEQNTIPRDLDAHDQIPGESGAVSILFESSERAKNKILCADILLETQMGLSARELVDYLLTHYFKIINENSTNLYIRKNSYLWSVFQYYKHQLPAHIHLKHFSGLPGCLQPWQALSGNIFHHNTIVLDQDVESLNAGILIIEGSYDK